MRFLCQLLMILPFVLETRAASAINLTNRDTADQKLIIIEGDTQKERVIMAGEKLVLCEKACVIRVPGGGYYEFGGPETVSVEEGLLFLDTSEVQGQAAR